MLRSLGAFIRRDALIAASYRARSGFSFASLITIVVPLYFIAGALQPVMGEAIASEGGQFFAFVVVGTATYQFVVTAVAAVPNSLANGIRTGTLESWLASPTNWPTLIVGMLSYPFLWTVLRSLVLVLAGALLGAQVGFDRIVPALLIWAAITLSYLPFGILGGALLLLIRTTGPLPNAVMTVSVFLGGVYYPTHVIPSWLGHLSSLVPLTYGLRALRRVLIQNVPLHEVGADLAILAVLSITLLMGSLIVFRWALAHARRTGTLAQY